MPRSRPTPFDLVFEQSAQEAFPRIRAALHQGCQDDRDRDAFLMARDVVGLLRDLRPEEGLGEGIDQLAAFVHHAYLFWSAGEYVREIEAEGLKNLLSTGASDGCAQAPPTYYVQFPEHRLWAAAIPGQPPEPLDGCFVHSSGDTLRVLAVLGVHPGREGFSVVEASGLRPAVLAREDGTPLFAPVLVGGAAGGLFSLTGEEELLELGWRVQLSAGSWESGVRSSRAQAPAAAGSQLQAPSS
jgi:hypothetical protein